MCPAVCAIAKDFSQEQDFPERNFLQHGPRTPEELFSRAQFLRVVKLV
jgi:hypothetical protein